MVKKTFTFDIDIKKARSTPPPELVEGDNGNEFAVTLTDNGVPVDLTDCRVLILFSQPNGRTAQQDNNGNGVTMDETAVNKFTVNVYTTSFSPGTNNCEIQVLSGDNYETLVTSAQFNFECRRSILNDDTIQATNEYPILAGLISRVEEAEGRLVDIEANENARVESEADRIAAEQDRAQNEFMREMAEADRVEAENLRADNENVRTGNEDQRIIAESARVAAETARATAETARVRKWSSASASASTLSAGSPATANATLTDNGLVFNFGIPLGEGTPGKDGKDGATPVRGVDYWTAADKQEVIDEVLATFPTYGGEVNEL